jgi:hypothetical protein
MLREIVLHTLQIGFFVAMMMIVVEYLNVLTEGAWQRTLAKSGWKQYLVVVLLGATPGCLGAFAVVALYTHRIVSLGAVVACMIATSGDEAFVMFALFPTRALVLTLGLMMLGLVAGLATDQILGGFPVDSTAHDFVLHEREECQCFPRGEILRQLRQLTLSRGILVSAVGLFVGALLFGEIGPQEWNWMRWTLLSLGAFGLFITLTVPEHFLEQHLWEHTVVRHVPRVFAWTLGALVVIAALERFGSASSLIGENRWGVLGLASLLGVVPESGPHLLFVALYDKGMIPFSTLVASTAVQDGHGMLPLLAESRLDFLKVKGINLAAGLVVGSMMMALGW